jgi:hypothetical protein
MFCAPCFFALASLILIHVKRVSAAQPAGTVPAGLAAENFSLVITIYEN